MMVFSVSVWGQDWQRHPSVLPLLVTFSSRGRDIHIYNLRRRGLTFLRSQKFLSTFWLQCRVRWWKGLGRGELLMPWCPQSGEGEGQAGREVCPPPHTTCSDHLPLPEPTFRTKASC